MKESAKTKSHLAILKTSKVLFKKYGIRKVTVEEICEEAKVSKMTFYRFYKNKVDLTEHVLTIMHENQLEKYRSIMKQDIDFVEKIQRVILLRENDTEGIGKEFLKDIYKNTDNRLKKLLELHNNLGVQEFMKDIEKARHKGEISKEVRPELVLYMIGKLTESLTDENLLALYDTPQKALMAVTNFFFKGIGSK